MSSHFPGSKGKSGDPQGHARLTEWGRKVQNRTRKTPASREIWEPLAAAETPEPGSWRILISSSQTVDQILQLLGGYPTVFIGFYPSQRGAFGECWSISSSEAPCIAANRRIQSRILGCQGAPNLHADVNVNVNQIVTKIYVAVPCKPDFCWDRSQLSVSMGITGKRQVWVCHLDGIPWYFGDHWSGVSSCSRQSACATIRHGTGPCSCIVRATYQGPISSLISVLRSPSRMRTTTYLGEKQRPLAIQSSKRTPTAQSGAHFGRPCDPRQRLWKSNSRIKPTASE